MSNAYEKKQRQEDKEGKKDEARHFFTAGWGARNALISSNYVMKKIIGTFEVYCIFDK